MLILIAGKQRSLRNALKGFLQTRPGYEISGMVADKAALFKEVENKPPSLLILDEDFADLLVEEVILPLQQFEPYPQMIVLVSRAERKTAYLDAGVAALVEKTTPPKSLLTTMEAVRLR